MKSTSTTTLAARALVLAAISSVYGQAAEVGTPSAPTWLSKTFGDDLPKAIADGTFNLNGRLRYERADFVTTKPADALTIRNRFGFTTGSLYNFKAMIEAENTRTLGPNVNYNDGSGNNPGHAVVADPELTEINRAWLAYSNWDTTVKAGRQRIIHDGARFMGNVGWRQAEQTFDAVSLVNTSIPDLKLDYAYIFNVKRINSGNRNSDTHAINLSYTGLPIGKITGYAYLIEFPKAAAAIANQSSHTYGISLSGSRPAGDDLKLSYLAEVALQTEGSESALNYQAEYYHLNGGAAYKQFSLEAGYEVLGTDNNVGFYTPLATLAKWNGWADAFLAATPGAGLRDLYLSGTVKLPYGMPLNVTYHHFSADIGDTDLGEEVDITLTKKLTKNFSALARYAWFNSSTAARPDRDKFWLQVDYNF
jgi:hypothetical protein